MKIFSDRLTLIRKEKGIIQKVAAENINVSYRMYQYYEAGTKEPTIGVLIAIAKYFNVSADWLLGLKENRE